MGLGGVIVWSLDMDDKTGKVCNQGPYPVLNTLKRELTKPLTTTIKSTQEMVSAYPRGFFSKKSNFYRRSSSTKIRTSLFSPFCRKLNHFFWTNFSFLIFVLFVN
jgi:hypothetical protein